MPGYHYGAPPVAKTFLVIRTLQVVAFVAIIGIMANFVAEIVTTGYPVASEIVGTLTVTSIAALYCLITVPFFWAGTSLGLLIMCGFDFLLLIAFVVIAVVLGKPLSYLNCAVIDSASSAGNAAGAFAFTESLGTNLNSKGNFFVWTGATKANCYETKGAWGMSIALCIFFACSSLVLPALFAKQKRANQNGRKNAAYVGYA